MNTINLGLAGNYTLLTKSGITNVPESSIIGNIGTSPISSNALTGFALVSCNQYSTSAQVNGKIFAPNFSNPTPANLTIAILDMQKAYTDGLSRSANFTELYTGDLSGKTLNSATYKWSTGVLISKDVTLSGNANSIFIFQIAKGITLATGTKIILSGGVQAKNIFWVVAETVSILAGCHFEGTILAKTNITLGANASINGRLLAQTAVTLIKNTIVGK
jgi:cytoskeletal protein CcmA (bactofilin family)